ncbi:hypothetical protein CBS115989_5651 [Aspergillus niger]|uniref:Contig An13c0080, genomic contig n=4 Tax=Aspergillus niger TaxID=5061 RepID=A2R1V1_ASPNC|nr:uncharacterized protein An13g02540 [Aspergillus niger]XP_025458073.1 uncharacterized protein BO96DRAFT_409238 [Aspergillus niger CBS 101883]EHA27414.1 hypothetical protein ASPNIDRAFT_54832 [Aspergillus niger ATCC 1015]RDH24335.1 hypothetical protein M747DRAFT_292778 [Aspergillus niger ATCC 13496]KAI2817915.1 hypothetical protein CBS115989_5651 [Aspergillus niger]KAI2831656.1 hypothetical protein CBS133816_2248 [Aspergillus niger]KAI2853423.1 hypothetical protein CBS11350_161 [Aspergillus n|eukprot:XP_001396390.1 glutathione S-transferase [Aspergillus niger CBS 513.88]
MSANRGAKIVLNWLERSRAQRIAWLMEELHLDYSIQPFKRNPTGTAPAELKKIHPLGKSPTISIQPPSPTSKPIILAETTPIMSYLVEHFADEATGAKLIPRKYEPGKERELGGETEAWMRYQYYNSYVEGSLMSVLQVKLVFDALQNAPIPFFLKPIINFIASKVNSEFLDQEFKTHYGFLEEQLATAPDGGPYICGKDLSLADIQLSLPVFMGLMLGAISKSEYPLLHGYAERLKREQGYRRVVERAAEVGEGAMLE